MRRSMSAFSKRSAKCAVRSSILRKSRSGWLRVCGNAPGLLHRRLNQKRSRARCFRNVNRGIAGVAERIMKIEVLYFPGCPNHEPAVRRVRDVAAGGGLEPDILEIDASDERTAKALGFLGSPTIRINGLDIEQAARGAQPSGLSCRRYPGGLPSSEMIRAAIAEAQAAEESK